MKIEVRDVGLVVEFSSPQRCLSNAVLGGGLGEIKTWLDLQVDLDYSCRDPQGDLRRAAVDMQEPVVGMLTAAKVDRYVTATQGSATAIATLGLRRPVAAAAPAHIDTPAGTINLLAVVDVPLTDPGLVNAVQTAVEAKAQALAAARVSASNCGGFATGTATDAVCIACPPGEVVDYAGPATAHGQDLAACVYRTILDGATAWQARRAPTR